MLLIPGSRTVGLRLCPHDFDGDEVVEQDNGVPDEPVGQGYHREGSADKIHACHSHVDVDH